MNTKGANNTKNIEIVVSNITGQEYSVSKSFVLPGHIRVEEGDVIEFTALETEATLIFPNKNLFGTTQEELKKGGDPLQLTVNSAIEPGSYPYAVITTANNDLASGSSFPRFIVE